MGGDEFLEGARWDSRETLNSILYWTESQCRDPRTGVMWSYFCTLIRILAAQTHSVYALNCEELCWLNGVVRHERGQPCLHQADDATVLNVPLELHPGPDGHEHLRYEAEACGVLYSSVVL